MHHFCAAGFEPATSGKLPDDANHFSNTLYIRKRTCCFSSKDLLLLRFYEISFKYDAEPNFNARRRSVTTTRRYFVVGNTAQSEVLRDTIDRQRLNVIAEFLQPHSLRLSLNHLRPARPGYCRLTCTDVKRLI